MTAPVTYRGHWQNGGGRITAETTTETGQPVTYTVTPRTRHRGRTPALAWGYPGAGPSDTALTLLADTLGPAALCPHCGGTSIQVFPTGATEPRPYNPATDGPPGAALPARGPCWCDNGFRKLPWARFRMTFVEDFPPQAGWTMTQAAITAWLNQQPDWPDEDGIPQ